MKHLNIETRLLCNGMKVVQTELSDIEYRLLKRYASDRGLSIKDAIRTIIREKILEDRVINDDTLFTSPPVVKGRGLKDDTSIKHDKYLYGVEK